MKALNPVAGLPRVARTERMESAMKSLLFRYATPLLTGLFLVILVSGVALFFHFGRDVFEGMHKWLGLLLIVPFALHLWRNWKPMSIYLRKGSAALGVLVAVLVATGFVVFGGEEEHGRGRPPQFALAEFVMASSVGEVAPIFDLTPAELVGHLADAGFVVWDEDQTLNDIAAASGRSAREMSAALAEERG